MQKENPFWNSVHQIKIRCAKYKFAERSHNFLMQLPMQLIFGVRWEFDKLQICAKENPFWNSIPCERISKKSKKSKKLKQSKKSTKKWFDRAAPWTVYVYLISSTSMQKENPFWNSVRQIEIRCAKYKFAERSHNFLMQLPIQLIFGVSWDVDKLQICAKGKYILEFHSVWKGNPKIQKIQKIKT